MKQFLFISDWINPFEPHFGGAQRSNLLLRAFLQLGNVDVIAFADGVESNMDGCKVLYSKELRTSPYVSRLKKWSGLLTPWNPYSIYPINKEKEVIVDGFVAQKKYDAIVVRYVPEAMTSGLMKYADRLIIDVDDHPKDALYNMARQINSKPNKIYHYIASALAPITVRSLANQIKAALFPNPLQIAGKHGYFLPNISLEEPQTEYVDFLRTSPCLFFVGRLDYGPNYLGIDWFIDNVWPIVKQNISSAEFHVAGKFTMDYVVEPYFEKWRAIDGISVLGFIDDINTEYAACRATISPIFAGAGTNIKLIESMQRKRVCITTECGLRGMKSFISTGKEVLVASDAKEFAQMCIRALTDETFNHQIAGNAYAVVEKYFTHQAFNNIIGQIMNKQCERSKKVRNEVIRQ